MDLFTSPTSLKARLAGDERGVEGVEYAIILAVVVLLALGALAAFGGDFGARTTGVQSQVGSTPG